MSQQQYDENELPPVLRAPKVKPNHLTTADCVRAAIPGASDELCSHIVWDRTPYPFAKLTARDFYKAASRWRRACANHIQLCDFCDRPAVDGWNCQPCSDALRPGVQ